MGFKVVATATATMTAATGAIINSDKSRHHGSNIEQNSNTGDQEIVVFVITHKQGGNSASNERVSRTIRKKTTRRKAGSILPQSARSLLVALL